jgi:predicted nucleic acid-binding protein
VILCDAGPLIALLDVDDKKHKVCTAMLSNLPGPLLTTWPCLAEAMYLLGQYGGHPDQDKLWGLVEQNIIVLHVSSDIECMRMRVLMNQYKNVPMDLADASLVAVAEVLGISRIFTTDSDFYIYRINSTGVFEVVP